MLLEPHIKALRMLARLLEGIDWRLVGSTNLSLQGVAIKAKDIDIQIDRSAIQATQTALADYCISEITYSEQGQYRSYFGRFTVNNLPVEVIADLEVKKENGWQPTVISAPKVLAIKVSDFTVPCLDLRQELEGYELMGRDDKAELIRIKVSE